MVILPSRLSVGVLSRRVVSSRDGEEVEETATTLEREQRQKRCRYAEIIKK